MCGTAIGMPCMVTSLLTPSRLTSAPTARVNSSHCTSGSGPLNSRNGVPVASLTMWTISSWLSHSTHLSVSKVMIGRRER